MDELHNILEGCKRNDRKCQEGLYYQFYPALFNLCKKFFKDDHDIQTALNNGMMRVFKNIGQYDPGKGDFFNWVYTIVRNSSLTILRDRKKEIVVKFTEDIPDYPLQDPFETTEWEMIFQYLDRLPPATRAVCSLFYLEGFSVKEIGKEMALKEGTVKWHLSESRSRLKEIFTKSEGL